MLQWIKHFYKYQYSYNTSTTINSFSPELKRGGSHGLQNEYMWFKGWKTFHVQQKNRPITKSISFALSSWETTFIKDLPRNGMLIGLTQLHYLLNQGCFFHWTSIIRNEHVHTQMNMFIHKWTCSYANEHVHTQMNIVHYFFMPHVMHLNIQWTFIMRHVRVFLNMQHKKKYNLPVLTSPYENNTFFFH